nr:VTT domain-containing protein [Pseudonocardia acidicola]
MVIVAGAYSASGPLILGLAVVAATAGSFVSDLAKYGLGRLAGPALLRRLRRYKGGARAIDWIEARMLRTGSAVIAPAYFVPFGVVTATILTGALRMRLRGVVLASACGAALWSATFMTLGYVGGALTGNPLTGLLVAIPGAVVVGMLARRGADRVKPSDEPREPAVVSGPGAR